MTTTAMHLMYALGWQGGTIHQVASATGLKVETVLNLSDYKVEDSYQLQSYTGGYCWAREGGKESNIPHWGKGDIHFWLGVLTWQENKQ